MNRELLQNLGVSVLPAVIPTVGPHFTEAERCKLRRKAVINSCSQQKCFQYRVGDVLSLFQLTEAFLLPVLCAAFF